MTEFSKKIQDKFTEMCKTGKLFRVAMTGDWLWNMYLSAFTKENNPVFRDPNSTSHNCNHCKNFIRRYGNIVSIDENYNIQTMFDVTTTDEYQASTDLIAKTIKQSKIVNVFFETFNELNSLPYEVCHVNNDKFQLGVATNVKRYTKEEAEKFGVVKPNEVRTFNHLSLKLDRQFVSFTDTSVESIMADYKSANDVFQRGMETISLDTLKLVKDLILQGSMLDGQTHLYKIENMIGLKTQYDALQSNQRANWCWIKSFKAPYAKFRNELIGVLCSELSEGKELNEAVQSWNKRVDPINYMKTTAPITKRQIADAKAFVEENGYTDSFTRRHATIDDIKASEILHLNNDGKIASVSIFDTVAATSTRHKRSEFDGVEEVTIDKFMAEILPSCTSVEAFLTNRHSGNLVNLTTAYNKQSKPIFKWDNNYSWTFNGNLAGKSQLKEAVKTAGGKVDGVLRFSISWNHDGKDILDFDAHAVEPNGTEIFFRTYKRVRESSMSGMLDVDMINPPKMGVENIVWSKQRWMKDGDYRMFIHNYNNGKNKGFHAEIEFDGETYSYEYNSPVTGYQNVAIVTLKEGKFSIKHLIPESSVSSQELYGLTTNEFHKVSLICLSPNHWGDNKVGNKHYLFMLNGCKSPVAIRSFHNENLIPELAEHRKVLEILGATQMIEPSGQQLSGIGFNATVRDELILKLQGTFKRVIKVKF